MKELFLAEPSAQYQKSFENYALAYKRINDTHYYNKYKKALENYNGYLDELNNLSKGIGLAGDEVPTSTFWLVAEGEVVGVLRLRHREMGTAGHIGYDISPEYRNRGYGFQILKLALEKAIEIGIEELILTCNVNNIASRKIIEGNGGKMLGSIYDEEEDEHLYKFSITLTNN